MLQLFKKKDKRTALEKQMDNLIDEMGYIPYSSDYYSKNLSHLERLSKIKEKEKTCKISPDTWLIVIGNLVGIVLVLSYEKVNIITSRAFNLILKGRV